MRKVISVCLIGIFMSISACVDMQALLPPVIATETILPTGNFDSTVTLALSITSTDDPRPTIAQATTSPATCNRAAAGQPLDVDYPDDSLLLTGKAFTKTWRIVNAGSCPWTEEYKVVWFSADQLSEVSEQPFASPVLPGESVDISIDMVAPIKPGTYQSYWKIKAPDGQLFGIGPAGNGAFWVRILVVEENQTPIPTIFPTNTSEPLILAFGAGVLQVNDEFDFDKGIIVSDSDGDLRFQIDEGSLSYLLPINGSKITTFGFGMPTSKICYESSMGMDPISLNELITGEYLCYQTSQGLPGYLRVDIIGETDISFQYLTWSIP